MPLSKHVDPDYLEDRIFEDSKFKSKLVQKYISKHAESSAFDPDKHVDDSHDNQLVARFKGIKNKYKISKHGMPAELAYNLVHDELTLDGSTTLNLASFVNVHAEPESLKLIHENLTKNLADNDEYPMLIDLQERCVSILANLWHAPLESGDSGISTPHQVEHYSVWKSRAIGTACTGSSEAVMLGGLAMKKNWQAKRKAKGLSIEKPNILMASCCQVALEKFARYFDVENRVIGVSKKDFLLDCDKIKSSLDENTIGIFVIVGSTYTGGFENVQKVSEILDEYEKESGNWIPIHVDGASGGFVAPIIYPDLEWDFRNDRVMSINTSGHKFGLVTAGLGWVLFRTEQWLPEELKFQLQYLGGLEESFSLNFSRPGYQVIHQYYNFIHLGIDGYREIFDNCITNARLLSCFLEETKYFTCISNIHLPKGVTTRERASEWNIENSHANITDHEMFNPALPVVSFQFTKEFSEKYPEIPQSLVSKTLRNRKWIIPNYQLPKTKIPAPGNAGNDDDEDGDQNNEILRVVVKFDLTAQLLDKLMHDIVEVVEILVHSVEMVRENVKAIGNVGGNEEEIGDSMVYNMLLSIANDGDKRLIKMRNLYDSKAQNHYSFKGPC